MDKKLSKKPIITASFAFIILMAFVSMFSDMTHEAANSINGSFESFLGAPTIVISVVGGIASLLGFGLRLLIGFLSDKTKKYWLFTIIGYFMDLVFVPLLALVPENGWVLAVIFIIMEKVGKAIKKPAKDTLISFAATENGTGKSFGLGEVLDQFGAVIGPIILTVTFLVNSNLDTYHKYIYGYAILTIPAVICFALLIIAYIKYRHPEEYEKEGITSNKSFIKSKIFILFLLATLLFGIGFIDNFGLISKHLYDLANNGIIAIENSYLPLLYSYAMLIDAIAAMVFGLLFDKKGFLSIVIATALTTAYPFFIFYINTTWSIFVGLSLWGIGVGALESVMKSCVVTLSNKNERGRAFGTYELVYGVATFGASFVIALLYDASKLWLSIFLCLAISISVIIFLITYLKINKKQKLEQNIIKK
jgi:MFS-type transporter involved in bile tolerance (Atg22 family)